MSRDARAHGRGGRLWSRVGTVALALVVIGSLLAVAPATAQEESPTFIVEQGGRCIQITPLGNGSQSVEAFYDYRSPAIDREGMWLYSSYGTTEIQISQVSQIFVYRGSEGLSLVFLHDKFGDGGGGFVATADITGLPPEGEWVVEDDTYTNRNDVFEYSNGSAHIVWGSNGNRTDGAVFRGLRSPNYTTITVEMQFNEASSNYPYPEWDGPPEANEIERWIVRSGTGETFELDMDEPITISPGTCSGGISTFTPAPTQTPDGTNATTTTSTPPTTATRTATATQAASPTATQTPSPTPTPTATQTQTPTTTPTATLTATQTTTATQPTAETTDATGGSETTGGNTGDESGVFGPGFGVVAVVAALVLLAAVGLARRSG